MKIYFKKFAHTALALTLILAACNSSEYEGYELTEDGLNYKFYKQNKEGKKPQEGDVIKLTMVCRNSKDSITFDSKKVAPQNFGFQYSESTFGKLFLEALAMLSSGDSASFKMSADSVFSKNIPAEQIPPFIEKGTVLTFDFKVDTILTKEEVKKEQEKRMEEYKAMTEMRKNEEPKILAKYIQDNNIKVKPTSSGLYFVEVAKGKGRSPQEGERILVNYTGRFISGEVFDTSDKEVAKKEGVYSEQREPYGPVEFVVGGLIKGMNEGLKMMKPGSKATMIIPSEIAYGDGQGRMDPFATLIFDVELIDYISDKK